MRNMIYKSSLSKNKRSDLVQRSKIKKALHILSFGLPIAYLVIMAFFTLCPAIESSTHADTSGTYMPDLTLSTSGNVGVSVTASGSGRISSGKLTATVNTNSPVGYTLAISSGSANGGTAGNLTNDSSADALYQIGKNSDGSGIAAPITAPIVFSTSFCNQWGFAIPSTEATNITNGWNSTYATQDNLLTTNSGNTLKYAGVPTVNTTIRNQTAGNSVGLSESTDIYIAACAGGTGGNLPSGSYQGAVTLTALANTVPGPTITSISPNSGPTVGGTTVTITGTNFGSSSNPLLTAAYIGGSQSNGWGSGFPCTNLTVISSTQATCVTPGQIAAGSNMQDVSQTECNNLAIGSIVTVTDARDGQPYRIKKMPDNKCWMLDNLAYAGGGTNTYGDVHNLTFATATNTAGGSAWTSTTGTTTQYVTTNNFTGSNQTTANGQTIQNTTATLSSGTQCTTSVTGTSPMDSSCLSYLYNWCAAIGLDSTTTPTCAAATNYNTGYGTGYVEQTNGGPNIGIIGKANGIGGESQGSTSGTVAGNPNGINSSTSGSICPAGWRLPVGRVGDGAPVAIDNSNNEWAILNSSFYNNTFTATPDTNGGAGYVGYWQPTGTSINLGVGAAFGTVSAGQFMSAVTGGLLYQSTSASWWTSSLATTSSAPSAATADNTVVSPGTTSYGKYFGLAVRCVMNSDVSAPTNSPTPTPGTFDLSVNGVGGWYSKSSAFTFQAPPTVTQVALNFGFVNGGNSTTIYGTNFTTDSVASIGGHVCASTTYISNTAINCVTGTSMGSTGSMTVNVTNSIGIGSLANGFTYMVPTGWLQGLTPSTCNNMAVGSGIILEDARDNKVYRIAKMPDNKCWMVDNLAYTGGGTNTYGDVVPFNPIGIGAGALNASNGTSSSLSTNWTTSTGITSRFYTNNSSDYFYSSIACVNAATGADVMTSACGNQVLYNFCAAIGLDSATTPTCISASSTGYGVGYVEQSSGGPQQGIIGKANGIGGESMGNSLAANQAGINSATSGSICPAGWRLPVGMVGTNNNTHNECAILNGSFHNNTLSGPATATGAGYYGYWQPAGTSISLGSPAAFGTVSSGRFNASNGLEFQSTYAFWWASSMVSTSAAATATTNVTSVNPNSSDGEYFGQAVRCVFP